MLLRITIAQTNLPVSAMQVCSCRSVRNVHAPNEIALEHLEMNTNDAYATNTTEIATTENIAYVTAGDTMLHRM